MWINPCNKEMQSYITKRIINHLVHIFLHQNLRVVNSNNRISIVCQLIKNFCVPRQRPAKYKKSGQKRKKMPLGLEMWASWVAQIAAQFDQKKTTSIKHNLWRKLNCLNHWLTHFMDTSMHFWETPKSTCMGGMDKLDGL